MLGTGLNLFFWRNAKMKNFRLSKQQIRELALAVYPDIAEYVRTHQQEYELFLKQELELENAKGVNEYETK